MKCFCQMWIAFFRKQYFFFVRESTSLDQRGQVWVGMGGLLEAPRPLILPLLCACTLLQAKAADPPTLLIQDCVQQFQHLRICHLARSPSSPGPTAPSAFLAPPRPPPIFFSSPWAHDFSLLLNLTLFRAYKACDSQAQISAFRRKPIRAEGESFRTNWPSKPKCYISPI